MELRKVRNAVKILDATRMHQLWSTARPDLFLDYQYLHKVKSRWTKRFDSAEVPVTSERTLHDVLWIGITRFLIIYIDEPATSVTHY